MKPNRKHLFLAGTVALILAAGAGLAGRVSASGPMGGGPSGFGHSGFGRGGFGHGGFGRDFLQPGGLKGAHDQALAEALGISVDKLTAAQEKAATERLAQAVKDGKLTQEQADLMTAGRKLARSIDRQAIAAEVLGLSKADLDKALKDGKSLRDLAADSKLDRSALREKMQTAMEAAVADAVKAGTITQAQADALKAARDKMGKGGFMGRFGHGRGFGKGFGRGETPDPEEGQAPEGGPDGAFFAPGAGPLDGNL